ncbi:class I SAM-dependent methyltransferase [Bailinhaonella thermotolerans]|uniref:Methyltransferase domain-containing protein n=1 Tax=Bailinhaonella thermotolerans TaxID=1070861 RepID=A0A3A4A281_9ACTN|nr:class I SAM-dependent methyltransferase [Bailinhaonella thermotolerans]RJL20686.1 methyltransferase domain-containing protein [Bailinhaonella thermotolerans]
MHCRSCRAADLTEVLDLGEQYLSDFRDDDLRPPRRPLVLMLCRRCGLAQLRDTTPPELLYHDRYGFRSGVNEAIREDLRSVAAHALRACPGARRWLDIACNDGTLLSFVPGRIHRAGIDPVAAFAPESRRHADRVVVDFFDPARFAPGPAGEPYETFDVITSVSMFYDLDDPNEFVAGVARLLAPGGVWVIQQNYALSMVELGAVDNVCHEHVTYWSLATLEDLLRRHGLEVNDVLVSGVNGGSFRTLVSRRGTRPVAASVAAQRRREAPARLGEAETWRAFAARARRAFAALRRLIDEINAAGQRCYIYGASTRGGTIWQAAGLTVEDLPYAVERQPAKIGRKIASIGVPIISEERARADRPEYMLVSPWFFREVFVEREREYLESGGRLIFPLPDLEIVGAS